MTGAQPQQQPQQQPAAMPDDSSHSTPSDAQQQQQQPLRIGVLALQGSFREHMALLAQIPGVVVVEVRTAEELASVAGLIIPGGESTTMALVAESWGLIPQLQAFAKAGRPVWGTCAGMIFLAERAEGELLGWLVGVECMRRPARVQAVLCAGRVVCRPAAARVWCVPRPQAAAADLLPCAAAPHPAARRPEEGRPGAAGRPGHLRVAQLLWRAGQQL